MKDFIYFVGDVKKQTTEAIDFSYIILQKLEKLPSFEEKVKNLALVFSLFPFFPSSGKEIDLSQFSRLREGKEIQKEEIKENLPPVEEIVEFVLSLMKENASAQRLAEEFLLWTENKGLKKRAIYLAVLLNSVAIPWIDLEKVKQLKDNLTENFERKIKWFHNLILMILKKEESSPLDKALQISLLLPFILEIEKLNAVDWAYILIAIMQMMEESLPKRRIQIFVPSDLIERIFGKKE